MEQPLPNLPNIITEFLKYKDTLTKDQFHKEFIFKPVQDITSIRDIVTNTYSNLIVPYYVKRNIEPSTGIWNLLAEPIKNANYHGGTKHHHEINFGVYLTPHALVASYNDKGNYFKRPEVKEAWENKILFPEKHKVENPSIGFYAGTFMIYDLAELIHVDTLNGTLYTAVTTNNYLFMKINP